jgi:probable HAF family extracellular repeat protein
MTFNHCFRFRSLILAASLITGLSLVTHATAQEQRSFLVNLNSKAVTHLGTLGGESTYARSINDAGQVVGYSFTAEGASHAFITGPME